ncbi:hypothetical protein [Agriterribacter sp.]|uniref:hypothetical protein n=1 Tax=Agriterribacter sp. TaxID=2821509 RepID=UPI002BB0416B|nr:hypothetical protein [Agriterribacter sp.]HTN08081.1 hypothetical protein [Agriterribacter sp.]
MKRNTIIYYGSCCMFLSILSANTAAQKIQYSDGRPAASLRMECRDEGIVMRYGDGKDSCDTYGAREAVVNKEGDTYYLFYDGAGKDGWISCLAESKDLRSWTKQGTILTLGDSTKADYRSASTPWAIKEKEVWHMFYMGTPNTTPPPYRIPAFPYLTMKAQSKSLRGPWIKQYDVTPLPPKENSYYSVTSSPGFMVKHKKEYLMFFSGAAQDNAITKRTLGIARTRNLNRSWKIDSVPVFPLSEQIENSSLFYDHATKTWFLFTNHIGIDEKGLEYTDAIWVYWSKDINTWNTEHKAVVLDSTNSVWAKGAIGMPAVIKVGDRLALLYDAAEGQSRSHMFRSIGLAWMDLPLKIPGE